MLLAIEEVIGIVRCILYGNLLFENKGGFVYLDVILVDKNHSNRVICISNFYSHDKTIDFGIDRHQIPKFKQM